jgi:hypothetical protein
MPRNEAKPLSAALCAVQRENAQTLSTYLDSDTQVFVRYFKRNGTESSSTGKVTYFNGAVNMDTGSVTIDTDDKGPRTVNLHNIVEIKEVEV